MTETAVEKLGLALQATRGQRGAAAARASPTGRGGASGRLGSDTAVRQSGHDHSSSSYGWRHEPHHASAKSPA